MPLENIARVQGRSELPAFHLREVVEEPDLVDRQEDLNLLDAIEQRNDGQPIGRAECSVNHPRRPPIEREPGYVVPRNDELSAECLRRDAGGRNCRIHFGLRRAREAQRIDEGIERDALDEQLADEGAVRATYRCLYRTHDTAPRLAHGVSYLVAGGPRRVGVRAAFTGTVDRGRVGPQLSIPSRQTLMRENVRVAFRAENTSAMRPRRWDQETVKYHTKDEVERIFDQIEDPRDLLLFDLVYRHGLRREEAALLTLDDFRDGWIWIFRVKHGCSRAYRLHPRTLLLYQHYLAVRPDDGTRYLFRSRRHSSRPISGAEINRLFHKYATAAGLPPDRAHVHSLRHSIAVHLAEIGWTPGDVQYWLGHRDIKSTMVYFRITDKRAELLQEAMRRSDGIARTGR